MSKDPDWHTLAREMSDISEQAFFAGWMDDLEYRLWGILHGKARKLGEIILTDGQVDRLQALSDRVGGWVWFDDGVGVEEFIERERWQGLYDAWVRRRAVYWKRIGNMHTKWGLYQWFEEHGVELIHPDDLATVRRFPPGNRVFQVIEESGGLLRLRSGDIEFRAYPALFEDLKIHPRPFGSEVLLRGGRRGKIFEIYWHFQKGLPMYHVLIDGKVDRNRFWESDFV